MFVLNAEKRRILTKWFKLNRELYIDVFLHHSGSSGTAYFVRSIEEIEDLISHQEWRSVGYTIFREMQFPLRGIADNALLAKALAEIPDGDYYAIVSLDDFYPHERIIRGSGNTHEEMRQDFTECRGYQIGFGRNPFDYDTEWIKSNTEKVMVIENNLT
jgi:hypothetical protein